uniref:Uncharacterized protein n=1 Tax=Anopheles coluzzii TaxID=1518534 RepID=A0A8W7PRP2_ANOCL
MKYDVQGGRCGLAIDLAEHDVQRADDGDHVREHVVAADLVERGQMGEPGRLDLAPTLVDDAERLAHLLHSAQVAIVAVALGADRHVELDQIVRVVRLRFAQVPLDAGTAQHHAAEAVVQCVLGRHHADVDGTLHPDAIGRQHVLHLVQPLAELGRKLVDVVQQPERQVLRYAARPDIGGVHARPRHALVKLHHLLALLEQPEEGREGADVQRVRTDRHDVVQDARDLREQHADVLGPQRDVDVEQLLDRERVALLVAHHRHVVEPVEVRQRLRVRLVLDQLLGAAVQQPDVRIRPHHRLAVQLEHQPQYAVGGWVLRSKVEAQVAHRLLNRRNLAVPRRQLPAGRHLVRVHDRPLELVDELLVREPLAGGPGRLLPVT